MRRRWIGIRASAVLVILGSAATLLAAGVMAWTMFHAKLPREVAMPPVALKVFGVAMGVLFAGLGVWEIWTAVGIFRRRGWAPGGWSCSTPAPRNSTSQRESLRARAPAR